MLMDIYRTIDKPCEGVFKDKGSKFLAFAYCVNCEEEAKSIINQLKNQYPDARHHCYAYAIGLNRDIARWSDDGEPSGTAGRPIYNQIVSYQLTNIVVVVIRYFGGVLLGTSGLINAYKSATINALNNCKIVERFVEKNFTIEFDYSMVSQVKRIIKEFDVKVKKQSFTDKCIYDLSVRAMFFDEIIKRFNAYVISKNITIKIN